MILEIKTLTNQNIKVNPQHIKSVRIKTDYVKIVTTTDDFDICLEEYNRIKSMI